MRTPRENPEERAHRLNSIAMAKKHGPRLLADKRKQLEALVLTYPDSKSHEKLDALRDWFWGGALPLNDDPTTPSAEGK